jgi:putative transposase
METIRTPIRAPSANAHIERWIGSARRECLDRLLIFSRPQLDRILHVYVRHYNEQRPHRALDLHAPKPHTALSMRQHPARSTTVIRRRDLLGGLIHEYEAAAA